MAAQEFSSPGEHMASMSSESVSGGVAYRNPNKPTDKVFFGPPINFSSINNGSNLYNETRERHSARDLADDFNERYMSYNNDMFQSAKEYDMYMSNTAIQRQVDDLIKAGLNPILAAKLGGATYKGVNAPYLNISPSSALNSFLDYDSSMYQSNLQAETNIETQKMQNSSNEFIAQFNHLARLKENGQDFEYKKELINTQESANEMLEGFKHLNDKDIQKIGFKNELAIRSFQELLNEKYEKCKNVLSKEYRAFDNEMNKNYRKFDALANIYEDWNKLSTYANVLNASAHIVDSIIPF